MGISALVLTGVGCTTSTQVELELSRLRRELRQTKAETRELQKNVERLDGQMAIVRAKARKNVGRNVASHTGNDRDLQATASQPVANKLPELPVVRLNADVKRDSEDSAVMIKLGPSGKLPIDRSVLKKKDPVLSASQKSKSKRAATRAAASNNPSQVKQYEAALGMLREESNPVRARQMFTKFRARYPNSHLLVNVAYWMAEASFVSGDQAKAADEFLGVAEAYPRSMKAADALLRVAQIWHRREEFKRAHNVYTKISEKYPNSDAAKLAKSALASYDKKAKE